MRWAARIGSFLLITGTALALTGTAGSFAEYPQITDTARWLAQRKVEVHCQDKQETAADPVMQGGILGYVVGWRDKRKRWHPGKVAVMRYGLCEAILNPGRDIVHTALAVLVLTHESGHLRGHRWSEDEAKTECWAIRHFRYVATRLGLDANKLYPHALEFHLSLPPDYWLYDCVVPSRNAQ